MSRTSHINLPLLHAISAEKTQDLRLISPCLKAGVLRRFSDKKGDRVVAFFIYKTRLSCCTCCNWTLTMRRSYP